jgi:hypothetical protein
MSSVYKVAAVIFVVLAVGILAAYLIWFAPDRGPDPALDAERDLGPTVMPTATPTLEERLSERLAGVSLNTSDAVVGEVVAALSSNPDFVGWLANEDLVRRFVASIDSIASGSNPRQQLDFLRPDTSFSVEEQRGSLIIDPASYRRYDVAAEVFASLDSAGTVELYHELQPLIDEAYREISPPGRRFDDRLYRAIDHLLEVPVLSGGVPVEKKVLTYSYADERLESLSGAQRQFLRMGPDNVQRCQIKLRDLKLELQSSVAD